jgi:hypothetical protein
MATKRSTPGKRSMQISDTRCRCISQDVGRNRDAPSTNVFSVWPAAQPLVCAEQAR